LLLTGTTAEPMEVALERSFGLSARWVEGKSRNTQENAVFSAKILRDEGIRKVYLVTHYWHLPRAVAAFEAAGLEPIPAPVGLVDADPETGWWSGLLPDADAFQAAENLWHEWIGRVWYRVRYGY